MRDRIIKLVLVATLGAPVVLGFAVPAASAYSCGSTSATLTDYGGGSMRFSGSKTCTGCDIYTVGVRIHVQRCTLELLGCKGWGDVLAFSWYTGAGGGTVTDYHTMNNLACGNLYHTYTEGEGTTVNGDRVGYQGVYSNQAWYAC